MTATGPHPPSARFYGEALDPDGELRPRHVDLRPFVFLRGDGDAAVMPGGLTRVAFGEGAMVVNSTQNGGAKDTWVLP